MLITLLSDDADAGEVPDLCEVNELEGTLEVFTLMLLELEEDEAVANGGLCVGGFEEGLVALLLVNCLICCCELDS